MDTKNNKKKQPSQNKVKSGPSSKKMGKGNKVKAKSKKYATVDFMQSCAYNLPEGLRIPFNRSGKAILDRFSPIMDDSYPYKYTFHAQENPAKRTKTSDLVLVPKRTKVAPRRQQKVVTPSEQASKDLFNEVFFRSSSLNL